MRVKVKKDLLYWANGNLHRVQKGDEAVVPESVVKNNPGYFDVLDTQAIKSEDTAVSSDEVVKRPATRRPRGRPRKKKE